MDLTAFQRLLAGEGLPALTAADELGVREEDFLAGLALLERRGLDPVLAKAALETVLLRNRAAKKFSRAAQMFFLRDALEQSSGEVLARHRAGRFPAGGWTADLGCGIGGDSIALAERGPVLAVDRDELRLRMARANAAACRPAHPVRFLLANLHALPFAARSAPPCRAVFCDPSRREDARRIFSVKRYSPPLEFLSAWHEQTPGLPICVKISPGVRWEEIEREDCEVEFVSLAGDLKEAVLWYGPFRSARRRATRLPGGETLTDELPGSDALLPPRRVLYEPDPAILRAGLVRQLAGLLGAGRIDPDIAYLTAEDYRPTVWARAFQLEACLPFSLKKLRAWLRERDVGKVVVKKRGSPIAPEELEHRLRLRGEAGRILFLTRVNGKPFVLIANEQIG